MIPLSRESGEYNSLVLVNNGMCSTNKYGFTLFFGLGEYRFEPAVCKTQCIVLCCLEIGQLELDTILQFIS